MNGPQHLLWLAFVVLGCSSEAALARRDVAADLALLERYGIEVHVELTEGNPSARLAELRRRYDANAAILSVGPQKTAASLGTRFTGPRDAGTLVRAQSFGCSTMYPDGQWGALRAAVRGLVLDAMARGLVPPGPVAPMNLGSREEAQRLPSRRCAWGLPLASAVILLGILLARIRRGSQHRSSS